MKDGSLVIQWFDPGGTTGWAMYTAQVIHDTESRPEYYEEKFTAGQIGPGPHHGKLYKFLEQWHTHNHIVGTESFDFRIPRSEKEKERNKIELISREYIGVLKLYVAMAPTPVVFALQSAGTAGAGGKKGSSFWDNDKLKRAGKLTEPAHPWRHANDAMRHLLYYMTFKMNRTDLLEALK